MNKKYTVEELKAVSRDFVSAIDRSALGSFAVDLELLVIADSIQRIDMLHKDVQGANLQADIDDLDRLLGEQVRLSKSFTGFGLIPEVFHWWFRYGDEMMKDYANSVLNRSPAMVEERLYRFGLAANYPEMHPFFNMGIWDIHFIERCIADGVDPELALSLHDSKGTVDTSPVSSLVGS